MKTAVTFEQPHVPVGCAKSAAASIVFQAPTNLRNQTNAKKCGTLDADNYAKTLKIWHEMLIFLILWQTVAVNMPEHGPETKLPNPDARPKTWISYSVDFNNSGMSGPPTWNRGIYVYGARKKRFMVS